MVMTMRMIRMELLLIIMSRSPGFNSKRISECDDDDEEEEDGVDVVDRPTQLFYIWIFTCCVNIQI